MVRYEVEPVLKKFSNGKTAINILPDGSGMVFYPSGHAALSIEPTDRGIKQMGFDDDKAGTVLFNFDEVGVGSVMYGPRSAGGGKARFVCEKNRGMFLDENGDITRQWPWTAPIGASWKPDIPEKWTFKLNQYMTFSGTSRQNLKVQVRIESIAQDFDVGETLKRADDYLHTEHFLGTVMEGPDRGKKMFSFPPKTSTYHEPEKWQQISRIIQPGGFTAELEANVDENGLTTGSIVNREEDDATAALESGGKGPAWGMGDRDLTKKVDDMLKWRSRARMGTMKVMPFVEPDVMATLRIETSNELQSIGGPQPGTRVRLLDGVSSRDRMGESLVGEQKARELRLSGSLKPVDMTSGKDVDTWHHTKPDQGNPRRSDGTIGPLSLRASGEIPKLTTRKIREIKPKTYDAFLNGEVPKSQIVLVAVLQMWQPESRSIRSMMETCWNEWTRRPTEDGSGKEDVPLEELPYRLVRFAQEDSRYLIDRYRFHSTPMFLAYCGGKLVFAEPTFAHFRCTRDCMEKTLKEIEVKVKRGEFLPDNWRADVSNAQ